MQIPKDPLGIERGKGFFGNGKDDAQYIKNALENLSIFTVIISTFIVFAACWLFAIEEWGWPLGLTFGWLPSGLLTTVTGYVAYRLRYLVLLGIAGLAISLLFVV